MANDGAHTHDELAQIKSDLDELLVKFALHELEVTEQLAAFDQRLDALEEDRPEPEPEPDPIPDPDPTPDPGPDPVPPTPIPPGPSGVHVQPSTYLTIQTGGRKLTVNPNDNLRDWAAQAQAHDQFDWKAGTYGRGDITLKVPTQNKAQPGVRFNNIGGSKGVFVMEYGADLNGQGMEADDAVTIFDGFNFKDVGLPGGSNNNFAAFRIGKGHFIARNCIIDGGRQGILGQIYRGGWRNPTYEDIENGGKDIELVNCDIVDCGKGGKSHGIYTRSRRLWIENCEIWNDPATASYGGNPGFHDVKHLGSILDIHNSTIGHKDSNVAVPVDVSGHEGAVRIVGSTIIKGLWATQPRGVNRHFFNYLKSRLGDNWAPDVFEIDNCNLLSYFYDKQSAHKTRWANTVSMSAFKVTNTTIDNRESRNSFDVSALPNINSGGNTFVGNIQH